LSIRFLGVLWLNDTSYNKSFSEEVNRKLLVKNTTAVQLFAVYTDHDYHTAQRYRETDGRTDGRTDRPTGHRQTSWCQ